MDEFQFIESLDSLLSNEVIDETQTVTNSNTVGESMNNSNSIPVHGQGILAGPVSWGSTDWLPRTDVSGGTGSCSSNIDPFGTFRLPAIQASIDPIDQGQLQTVTSYPQHPFRTIIDNNNTTQTKTHINVVQSRPMLDTMTPSTTTNLPVAAHLGMELGAGNAQAYSVVAPPGTVLSVCSTNSRCASNADSRKTKGTGRGGDGSSVRSVGSGTTAGSAGTVTTSSRKRSRRRPSTEVSESEDENTRRRYDRNLREQRRSQKITEQIDELRDVLAAASIRFKPDKFSTLISVVDYVKQLQARSTMLDTEHKNLIDTISKTNEMVNESYLPTSGGGGGGVGSNFSNEKTGSDPFLNAQPDSMVSSSVGHDIYNDDELVFVRNVDYRCIFDRCGIPLAVASIDGRLLDCNEEFVKLTGYEHKELLPNKHQKQQTSALIADHVPSTSSAFPDVSLSTSSSSNNNLATNSIAEDKSCSNLTTDTTDSGIYSEQERSSVQHDDIVEDRTVEENQVLVPAINFSLFDLLDRNHMEEVFMSLSEMLKRPPREKVGPGAMNIDDHWWGNVHLNRNTQVEMRMTISLVRSPQGRAKFFDCSLTPLAV